MLNLITEVVEIKLIFNTILQIIIGKHYDWGAQTVVRDQQVYR